MSDAVRRLVEVMDTLRSPGGCPWDAEQTHESLARYLLEETYEALEAMDKGDLVSLKEELGDLLLQVVFHARIAQETDPSFTLDAIADTVVEKLERRHPHVFTDMEFESTEQLEDNWAEIKKSEKQRESVTDGVPKAMPALQQATQLFYRSRKFGLEFEDKALTEQLRTLVKDVDENSIAKLLVSAVQLSREVDLDAESVLRVTMSNYRELVRAHEAQASTQSE